MLRKQEDRPDACGCAGHASCYVPHVSLLYKPASSSASFSLGSVVTDDGVHFAVASWSAHAVDVCLFDAANPSQETSRVRLARGDDGIWRGFVAGVRPGALYGF